MASAVAAGRDRTASATQDLPLLVVDRAAPGAGHDAHASRPALGLRRIAAGAALLAAGVIGIFAADSLRPMLQLGLAERLGLRSDVPAAVDSADLRGSAYGGVAAPQAGDAVVALGVLTPRGHLVTVAPPYGAGDARIAELLVEEGDAVEAGQTLAVLDNAPALAAAADAAEAALASRRAALAQARDVARAQRDEARSALARAEATERNARLEFERAAELRDRGVATGAAYDQKRAALDEATQDVAQARAALSRYDYADLDRQPDVEVAARAVDMAAAELAQAEADLDKAEARAPRAGVVVEINARPGERPGAAGVLTMGDIDAMTVEAEVYQAQIGAVAVGAAVEVVADALSETLHGVVARIGLSVGRQTLTDASPAANTDARVVTVHVDLTPESAKLARGLSNLQVTARIARSAPETRR